MASISRPFLSPLLCGTEGGSGREREGRVYQRQVDDDVDDSVVEFRDDELGGIAGVSAPWRCDEWPGLSRSRSGSFSKHFF